jgi:hypothetical protein
MMPLRVLGIDCRCGCLHEMRLRTNFMLPIGKILILDSAVRPLGMGVLKHIIALLHWMP